MQKALPSRIQVFNWVSIHLAQKLNQAAQNEDWTMVLVISSILTATLECMEESGS